jgi:FKBP-type peptidyl-prolyl cis-trans isomerase
MEAGRQFLAENAKQEGVTTTASGLQYQVLQAGNGGQKPSRMGEVEVHYEGKLIDGTVFDSSYARGESISFLLAQVIPGWSEGVQLMSVGDKYRFFIPFELAYGPQGIPGVIPPYSTLIFDVELLKVYS